MSTTLQTKLARFGLCLVFIVFGIWEMVQPGYWTVFVPAGAAVFGNPSTLVMIHGIVLLIISIPLLFGSYQRIFASLAALVLIVIIITLFMLGGFADIAVRDIGLLFVAISLIV